MSKRTGRIIERDEFSDHLAYAHTTGRSARLNFIGGGSIDLDGASISHDGNLERSALFANAQLPLLARPSDRKLHRLDQRGLHRRIRKQRECVGGDRAVVT